ncbi:MAG TPA: ABC transporter ATP-binding protein [Thermomicrobiales bacterium]|jgi:branched-chain amino acid transport system ATP-binding protein|nr:ABC transporter ATP-binding protein [Thermomicrobiales bacterium]
MLKVDNLRVNYGAIQAVKGITFEVEERELVALIGSNGAGKSTTLKTVSGIVRPSGGSITYQGRDLSRMPTHQIVSSGIVQAPEGRQIFGSLTVRENLMLGASARSDRDGFDADLQRVFDLFPILGERISQRAGTLSGGEQQMLAIGRALMGKPKLLLLDEPSLGLAPLIVNRIFDVIRQLKETGVTILLVEQNARKALAVADRAYVLETGLISLSGAAAELARNSAVEQAYLGGGARA